MLGRRWLGFIIVALAACGGGDGSAGTSPSTVVATTVETDTSPVTTFAGATVKNTETSAGASAAYDECAHVVGGEVTWQGETATVSATVSSADTGWDKYADAWEVRTTDGTVLGVRELAHPHENEQPFTRSLTGVDIPAGSTEVELAARDSVAGWCGDTLVVPVPAQP